MIYDKTSRRCAHPWIDFSKDQNFQALVTFCKLTYLRPEKGTKCEKYRPSKTNSQNWLGSTIPEETWERAMIEAGFSEPHGLVVDTRFGRVLDRYWGQCRPYTLYPEFPKTIACLLRINWLWGVNPEDACKIFEASDMAEHQKYVLCCFLMQLAILRV